MVLARATATAGVDPEQVAAVLRAGPDEAARILLGRTPSQLVGIRVQVERDLLSIEGQFWYRGEYRFAAAGEDTSITLEVHNVSRWPDRLIGWWQWRFLRRVEADLAALAASLPARVEASPYP